MDTFARGLRCAVELMQQGVMDKCVKVARVCVSVIIFNPLQQRYSTFDTGIGARIEQGESSFEELEVSFTQHILFLMQYISYLQEYIRSNGFPKPTSGQQEMYEVILNNAMKH